jgi:hypothetical protein
MRGTKKVLILGIGLGLSCGNQSNVPSQPSPGGSMGSGPSAGAPPDLGVGGSVPAPQPPYTPPHGGAWVPPPADDSPVAHGQPAPLAGATSMLDGVDVLDVSTDRGGGIWAVSASTVYYFPAGRTTPFTYDQSNGLARGWRTWQDPYYNGTTENPATLPVTFSAIAGAAEGEAVVGNIGAIGDRLVVDPKTGAVLRIENLRITTASTYPAAIEDHTLRVVATHKVIAVLDGTFNGTAYLGGWHGFVALHGLNGDCGGCRNDFEEHQHFIPQNDPVHGCDSSGAQFGCWDGDVWGLAMSPQGDVWAGDRHFVQLLTQGSLGPQTPFFGDNRVGFTAGIDVFPGVRDEVHGLAVDSAGGVWVASDGDGLAYLAPPNWTPMYWSAASALPQNHLRGVAIDAEADVWIGTAESGVARYRAADNRWTYYTRASGLADDAVNTLYVDEVAGSRRLFIATQRGITIVPAP